MTVPLESATPGVTVEITGSPRALRGLAPPSKWVCSRCHLPSTMPPVVVDGRDVSLCDDCVRATCEHFLGN